MTGPDVAADAAPRRVGLRTLVGLAGLGAVGAVALSVWLYDGRVVFPALMGAGFGLAVAATGQRRMRSGASDLRSRKVQAHYRGRDGSA